MCLVGSKASEGEGGRQRPGAARRRPTLTPGCPSVCPQTAGSEPSCACTPPSCCWRLPPGAKRYFLAAQDPQHACARDPHSIWHRQLRGACL